MHRLFAVILMLSLLAACAQAPAPTATPPPTLLPTFTPSPAVNVEAAVQGTLTALAPTATPGPSVTPTETPIVITLPPVLGRSFDPPLDITLPEGWTVEKNDALVLPDADSAIRSIPFVAYGGPITGGKGSIVLLWGFPNLANPFPTDGTPAAPDLWSDGLRLLRLAIVEQGCNVGTDLKRTYRVGLQSAVGTQFAAVTCPELADTRGWFAGLEQYGLNFVFYVYADPIAAMDTGSGELQAILDTVRFRQPELTPEATAAP